LRRIEPGRRKPSRLKLHFDTDESGIQFGDFTVCLTADLLSPLPSGETRIEACDNIAVR
jgi:hypothetical protein